ncbi:MAG: hypothetical protein H7A45_07885 [Verrucomicrobiales bacterium]|nr:hypothetical protein [Verrucomicrobiales bacterium]
MSIPSTRFRPAALALVLYATSASGAWSQTFQQTYKFTDSVLPPDTYLYGSANIVPASNGYVSLTEQVKNQVGTFIIDSLPRDQRVDSLTVDFKLSIDQRNQSNPADGFSFNFGPQLLNTSITEAGTTQGLAISVDTYRNNSSDTAVAAEIVYDGTVLAGISFADSRYDTSAYPVAKDATGQEISVNTSGNFIPVQVALADSKVTVVWNGTTILKNVAVPYTPAKGWRVGFGARTGSEVEAHHISDIEIAGTTQVRLAVESEYGGELVNPAVGEFLVTAGTLQEFSAPDFVYLDRYLQPLEPTDENIHQFAFYRARYAGVSIDGAAVSHLGNDNFDLTLNEDTKVNWEWHLEYLGEVETGASAEEVTGMSDSDVTDPAHLDTLGRHWYGPGADAGEIFTSVVYHDVGQGTDPIRFGARGYVIENAPSSPENSIEFAGQGDSLWTGDIGTDLSAGDGTFTIEFWARRNPVVQGVDQNVVCIGSVLDSQKQIRVGFRSNTGTSEQNAFFLANDVSGPDAPGSLTDNRWHHWAAVNDGAAGQITYYRDGKVVLSYARNFVFSGDAAMSIGTAMNGPNAYHHFSGGVNNVRVWQAARTRAEILESMRTVQYGNSEPDLVVEVGFEPSEDPFAPPFNAVNWDVYLGSSDTKITTTGDILTTWKLHAGGFLPNVTLPSGYTDYYGVIYFGYLRVDVPGDYTFHLSSDDGSRLLIDGTTVVDNDGVHAGKESFGAATLTRGYHAFEVHYFQDGGGASLSLEYEGPGINRGSIPDASLLRSLPPGIHTSEGKDLVFEAVGFDGLFPADTPDAVKMATVFPGFQYTEVSGMGTETVNIVIPPARHQYEMQDWTRVFWMWDKQFELVAKVSLPDSDGLLEVAQLPFFSGGVDVDGTTTTQDQLDGSGVMTVLDEWVAEDEAVTVGTVYRTADRRYTLTDVMGQLNGFGGITTDTVVDGLYGNAVTREVAFPALAAPGTLVWRFAPTVHQALLAIGEGLDVSSLAAVNGQLVPDLPTDVTALVINTTGPTVTPPSQDTSGPPAGGTGNAWQWDYVGRKFHPLEPGVFTLNWPNENGYTNTIRITAAFPTDEVTIQDLEDRQNEDGSREGAAPDYLTDVTFNRTGTEFPATPAAHYHYVVSPNADSPVPADMDENPSDRWAFQRLAYSEDTGALIVQGSTIFQDTTADDRSVLVFSYRPDPTQVANGDLSKELVAVRVVRSLDVSESEADAAATVGARITSPLDEADFGTGYLLYGTSNYNPLIYQRDAEVGEWGPIYPVNWSGLFTAPDRRLRVAFYQNPYLDDPTGTAHPDVAWPYVVVNYDTVTYPTDGNIIYIASRLGSEGVNAAGVDQLVFDPARYANLAIYNQPDRSEPGFNPNEEHALVAPSIKSQLTGEDAFNLGQSAAFALQTGLNRTDEGSPSAYTSEPVVLVQYENLDTGEFEMQAYRVEATRQGAAPFPALDPDTHLPVDAEGLPLTQPDDPTYAFDYASFAGDLLIPPYPLNLVVGNVVMGPDSGGNLQVSHNNETINQRTLWEDKNSNAWVVSGDGRFFYRNWYPLSDDFWFFADDAGNNAVNQGTPIAWLPEGASDDMADFLAADSDQPLPQAVRYSSYWRKDYPILKRGETLTYAGGEHQAENPLAAGLPSLVAWASAELVYDSRLPDMVETAYSLAEYTARVTRPLDRYTESFEQATLGRLALTPANTDKVMVDGVRWHFKDLRASLGKRFYYDSLLGELVLRGRLHDLEGGDPDLTTTPIALYILEANVMTAEDYASLLALGDSDAEWEEAVTNLYIESQNPQDLEVEGQSPAETEAEPPVFWSGLENVTAQDGAVPQFDFFAENNLNQSTAPGTGDFRPLNSLGVGSALVPNPTLLSEAADAPLYVTLAENNHPDVDGAVTLHIVEISDARYRGAIKIIEPKNVFDEKIELSHTGDFGGHTADAYYQWWVRDAATLDGITTPDDPDRAAPSTGGWQLYEQGLGLNRIHFAGRPDITLADKLFYVRYGEAAELANADGGNVITDDETASVSDASWRLVAPDDLSPAWERSSGEAVPYQWAGAANSPQLQANGSRRFLPQLVMGWVKRVLDRVNPFEARFSATFDGDAPATYSSMLQEAGGPYIGPVALNADKNAMEHVGLIELYETVLQRAKDLTKDSATEATNQALLLAATRLAHLYELLANEAYADAQNSSLPVANTPELALANPYTFAFQNQVPDLLHEELALLRGTDFLKSYPAFNRLFWNYAKGLSEAAYNVNYHIVDVTLDGIIDEHDAATLYPMGHGDAWGHYLSAGKMHYELLRRAGFDWRTRPELYSLLDNVIPADYLDEKSFAQIAAARARAGAAIVQETYRAAYVADPDGQWQGYTDNADPARGWGVSEWSKRAGQGAWFDWLTGNAIVPADADEAAGETVEGLERIDRIMNRADLSALAGAMAEIQETLNSANTGASPLGLDPDAIVFDLNPLELDGSAVKRRTHFEQVYDRAVLAARNALSALEFASRADQQLRRIADDTWELQREALLQDFDYRNRLIEIFGTPYEGTIGPGKLYAEGYSGPDTLLYAYLDRTTVEDLLPEQDERFTAVADHMSALRDSIIDNLKFSSDVRGAAGKFNWDKKKGDTHTQDLFTDYYLTASEPELKAAQLDLDFPFGETSEYAFRVPDLDADGQPDWGRRSAYGQIQTKLNELLQAEAELEVKTDAYEDYVIGMQILRKRADVLIKTLQGKKEVRLEFKGSQITLEMFVVMLSEAIEFSEHIVNSSKSLALDASEFPPKVLGFSNDATSVLRGSIRTVLDESAEIYELVAIGSKLAKELFEFGAKINELRYELDQERFEDFAELMDLLTELADEFKEDRGTRLAITPSLQRFNTLAGELQATIARGFRLVDERAALNMMIASKAQRNRYQDLLARLTRSQAVSKYESALDNALRYAWLAAKAYDYETSLPEGDPAAATTLLESLVQTRQLGRWENGEPRTGNGGLAEVLGQMAANFETLKAQTGINNPATETSTLSLRSELFRISQTGTSSLLRWKQALGSALTPDLRLLPEFAGYCRPFADPQDGPQPGLVIEFSTEITPGRNVFGRLLGGADHTYSVASLATRVRGVGVLFEGYDQTVLNDSALSTTPRVYLVPVGADVMRVANSESPEMRSWNVVNQRIPTPFVINEANLTDLDYIPSLDSLNGSPVERSRSGDFRAYPTSVGAATSTGTLHANGRLLGRSVWNTRWLLIIPGATLNADPEAGLQRFIDTVTDIKLQLDTYSSEGM